MIMRIKELQVLLCLLLLSSLTKWIVTGCSDGDIRLADTAGSGAVENLEIDQGRIQVCMNEVWGSVCDNHWDGRDARVACRQLGYESETALAVGYESAGITINIHRDYIECNGDEESLYACPFCSDCGYYNSCYREAGVICYPNGTECDDTDVRLVGDSGVHQGRVEVCFLGLWGTVCGRHWDRELDDYGDIFLNSTVATVICRQLGLPIDGAMLIALSMDEFTYEKPIFLDGTVCNGEEERLTDCSHRPLNENDECWHPGDIGVICQDDCIDGDVRLVGGLLSHEGRVEVCLNSIYGTVCDDRWDNNDAAVICYQLGFPREDARSIVAISLSYGIGSGSIWLDEVQCNGEEENITQCHHDGVGVHNCGHHEDAGVLCKSNGEPQFCTNGEIMLSGGHDRSEGRLEACINDRWGTVCTYYLSWGEEETTVLCQQLGFATIQGPFPKVRGSFFGTGMGPIVWNDFECVGNETEIEDCPSYPYRISESCYHHNYDAAVICDDLNGTVCSHGDIRLVDGSSPYEGRVELCLYNHWGTVCDDSWDAVDATVVCRQLNLIDGRGIPLVSSHFGDGIGIIWMDNVDCTGTETSLFNCTHIDSSNQNCAHNEDAGVICPLPEDVPRECENGEIQLVDGAEINEGRVEICYNNHWGTVCDDDWGDAEAKVVCQQLGFYGEEYLAEVNAFFGQGDGLILLDNVYCRGLEHELLECTGEGAIGGSSCSHSYDVGVTCPYVPLASTSLQTTTESTTLQPLPGNPGTIEPVTNSTSPTAQPRGSSFMTEGIVLGVVLPFIICVVVGVVFLCFVQRWHVKKLRLAETRLMLDELVMRQTDTETNKNQYATTKFQPANRETCQKSSLLDGLFTVEDLPDEILISASDIRLMDTLGQGEYGIVYKAHLVKPMIAPRRPSRISNGGNEQMRSDSRRVSRTSIVYFQNPTEPLTVAVKTLKGFFTEENVTEIIRESKKMQEFDHPNVLSMLGICLDAGSAPYIVMPFMSNGSLSSYLKANRQELMVLDTTDEETISIMEKRMTDMCLQIAKGMEYLASKKLIHRDLAARNCMIDSESIIKVADFGLSESTTTKDYFRQAEASNIKLPIKWMAPESLSDGVFSEKTDVWSFGVTCWEVFSGGMTPYRGVHPLDVINMLDTGKRLERPNNSACSETMYSMMKCCWHFDSKDRPNFSHLVIGIAKSLETLSDYLDVSTFQFSFDKAEDHRESSQCHVEDTMEAVTSTGVLSVVEEGFEEAMVFENTSVTCFDDD